MDGFGLGPNSPTSPSRGQIHHEYERRIQSPARGMQSPARNSRSNSITSANSSPRTPAKSPKTPTRDSPSIYSDRFIPSRTGSQIDTGYSLLEKPTPKKEGNSTTSNSNSSSSNNEQAKEGLTTLSMLLKSELLGVEAAASPRASDRADDRGAGSPSRNLFRFKAPRQAFGDDVKKSFSLSPVGSASQRLLSSPRKAKRKIPKVPFKVLDAPALQDDFYLNLVDWSTLNVLAVGLGPCVYLWSACTSKVTKLCDLGPEDCVTSVSWTQRGTHLAVGTNLGEVQIWEASRCKKIRTMGGHSARVGTMAWNAHILASGSRDRLIYQRDVRVPEPYLRKLVGHKQEVCGLRWSFDDQQLASGGNGDSENKQQ